MVLYTKHSVHWGHQVSSGCGVLFFFLGWASWLAFMCLLIILVAAFRTFTCMVCTSCLTSASSHMPVLRIFLLVPATRPRVPITTATFWTLYLGHWFAISAANSLYLAFFWASRSFTRGSQAHATSRMVIFLSPGILITRSGLLASI